MTPSFREILDVLNQHQVEFIVVGGVAAVIHGAPTTTFDLDALVRVNQDNAERLAAALSQLEARFREHQKTIHPTTRDILAGGHLLLLTRAGPLDILGYIGDRQRYEDLLERSSEIGLSVGSLRVLDLEALIAEKRRMGRSKDNAAIELLEEVLRHRSSRR
jgi:predicted nucleotidyltransferase